MLVALFKRGKKPRRVAAQSGGERSGPRGIGKGTGIVLSRKGKAEEMFQIQKGLWWSLRFVQAEQAECSAVGARVLWARCGGNTSVPAIGIAKTSASTALVGSGKEKVPGEPGQGWAARCHLSMPLPLTPFLPAH